MFQNTNERHANTRLAIMPIAAIQKSGRRPLLEAPNKPTSPKTKLVTRMQNAAMKATPRRPSVATAIENQTIGAIIGASRPYHAAIVKSAEPQAGTSC